VKAKMAQVTVHHTVNIYNSSFSPTSLTFTEFVTYGY